MTAKGRIALAVAMSVLAVSLAEAGKKKKPHLVAVGTYDTGLGELGARSSVSVTTATWRSSPTWPAASMCSTCRIRRSRSGCGAC